MNSEWETSQTDMHACTCTYLYVDLFKSDRSVTPMVLLTHLATSCFATRMMFPKWVYLRPNVMWSAICTECINVKDYKRGCLQKITAALAFGYTARTALLAAQATGDWS